MMRYGTFACAVVALTACSASTKPSPSAAPTPVRSTSLGAAPAAALPSLAELFKDRFTMGAALNEAQILGTDTLGVSITTRHFNTISPENVLKWERVHPEPGKYAFALPDAYVAFGERNKMFIVGHTLVWHSQTPAWVFRDDKGEPIARDAALARMKDHIMTVVGRYKGRIDGWDVVNEALNEDGTLRQSPWRRAIGDDYIEQAFRFAHEADPAAQLYYNDYSLENPPKRAGAIALVKRLQAAGIPIAGIGMQGHFKMDWPTVGLEDSTITMFAALGVKIHITEVDVDILPPVTRSTGADVSTRGAMTAASNPYAAGLPEERQQALAKRYAELFAVFAKHANVIDRVTFWGVADGDSWLNNWPAQGRTSYPLLFDRKHAAKPAFDAIAATAKVRVP